jgi:hypothetical protein
MNAEQFSVYLTALASSLTVNVIIPLLMLVIVIVMGWVLFARAQNKDGFHIADMLLDDAGKVSSDRVLAVCTWGASTWGLAVFFYAIPGSVTEAYAIYLGVWATNNAVKGIAKMRYGSGQSQDDKAP